MKGTIEEMTVIIPSYNPDEKLLMVVEGLKRIGFRDIVVVDDGSDAIHKEIFAQLQGCELLHHKENQGKGRALKTAFMYCLENRAHQKGVITVDGDNQHRPEDVLACAERLLDKPDKLILGCRDFNRAEVPFRSRVGNLMTRAIFAGLCGVKVSDTQTGLRAISMGYLPLLCRIEGERYEYETHMLLELKNASIPFAEVPIQTIYIEDNQSSHFHPLLDSLKIYKVIVKFVMNSMLSTLIDLGMFYLSYTLCKQIPELRDIAVIMATVVARSCSSLCNYMVSRKIVFQSKGSNSFVKYYILCVTQMLLSALLVKGCSLLVGSGSMVVTLSKALTDTLLFFISFRIQKNWVFRTVNAKKYQRVL